MLYLCLDCGNIFDTEYFKFKYDKDHAPLCPVYDCGGLPFEVDPLMAKPILKLNRKGYFTKFCCSGHVNGSSAGGYISFQDRYFTEDNDLFPPEGWKFDKRDIVEEAEEVGLGFGDDCVRYSFKKMTDQPYAERVKAISDAMIALDNWVDDLPINLNEV